jgi:hypothetical protein
MNRTLTVLVLAVAAACDQSGESQTPQARLKQLATSNATLVGYLYVPDTPYILASFTNGSLQWRTPAQQNAAQGPADIFVEGDKTCIGFEHKNPVMSSSGPEQYLVCEALQPIKHSNSLPRSQDFWLERGTLFLLYRPPPGTGYDQYFYASLAKQ